MTTAGTIIVNLAMSTAGLAAGMANADKQFAALRAQIAKVEAGSIAGSAAANELAAASTAAAKAAYAEAVAQEALAKVQANVNSTTNATTLAQERLAIASKAAAAAQVRLAEAQIAAKAPASGGFPLISAGLGLASIAIVSFGDAATKTAAKYQYDMELIRTQTGASRQEVLYMSKALLDLAPSVQAGPDALAQAMYHIESVGIRGAQALDVVRTAAQGAAVGNADLETVTNALVAVMKSGIVPETMNLATVMGILNGIVGTGNIRMQDLAASFSSGVLSTAKQFGLTIQDVGAAMATMADQGIPAEEAATRLRITIALLGAPTKIATAELSKIGLTQRSLAEEMRGPNGLIGALILLKAHMDAAGLDAVEQSLLLKTAFGGSRSSAGILTLINSLDLMGQKIVAISQKSSSFAADFAEESNLAEAQFRNFSAAVEVLKIKIGQGILPVVNLLVAGLALLAQQTLVIMPLFTLLSVAIGFKAALAGIAVIKEMWKTLNLLATVKIVTPIMSTAPVVAYTAALAASKAAAVEVALAEELLQQTISSTVPGMTLATGATLAERDAMVQLAISMAPTAAGAADVAAADALLAGAEATAAVATTGLAAAFRALLAAVATIAVPIGLVVGAITILSAIMGGFDKFVNGLMQGLRALGFLILGVFKAIADAASVLPGVGDAAKAMSQKIAEAQNQLTADIMTGYQAVAEGGAQAGIGGITGMIDAAEQAAKDGSTRLDQTLIQLWGTSLAGVEGAAATSGTKQMTEYAQAIQDARDLPIKALQDLMDAEKNAMSDGAEIARLVGELQGKELADGLASTDPLVAARAEATKMAVVDRLNQITNFAYMAGTEAGKSWQDALAGQMLASGSTQAQVDQAINNILYNPEKLAAANAEWAKGADTWRNKLAPSIGVATKAYQDFLGTLSKDNASQIAAQIVSSIGTDLGQLKEIGLTAGGDVMLAVAKGIKEKRDAPLNALKDLHKALQDQFDKDREIALLWGELTSKDIAEGMKNGDPYVYAQTMGTIKVIQGRMDELTNGAFSAGLASGNNLGLGFLSSKDAVALGTGQMLDPAAKGMGAVVGAAQPAGAAAGQNLGQGLGSSAPAVASGTATAINPVFSGLGAMVKTAFPAASGFVQNLINGLLSSTNPLVKAIATLLSPILRGLGLLPQAAFDAGKAVTSNVVAGATGAAPKAVSFADILQSALKGAGSQADYLADALSGVGSSLSGLASQAKSDMTSAFDAMKSKAHEFFDSLHEKNLKAIQDARDHKNALLDAKEALNQAPVTAAQKALDFQRSAQEEFRLRQAVANATDPQSQMEAVTALQDFLAQKHIDLMQDEVDAANDKIDAQKKANDELEKQQQEAENDRYKNQAKSFDLQLAALERYLKSHPAMWRKANSEIQALLKSFGIDYNTAGSMLGQDFVSGLWSAVADADKAAKALAKAGSGGGVSPYQAVPPPAPPPASAPPPPRTYIPGGTKPVPFATGAWELGSDTLALLHAREMVVPPDTAEAIRRVLGGRGFAEMPELLATGSVVQKSAGSTVSHGRTTLPAAASARAREVHRDLASGVSPSRSDSGGGTVILKVGEEKWAELTDRQLAVQDGIYGPRELSLSSRR